LYGERDAMDLFLPFILVLIDLNLLGLQVSQTGQIKR
jgi:hypothetical protein